MVEIGAYGASVMRSLARVLKFKGIWDFAHLISVRVKDSCNESLIHLEKDLVAIEGNDGKIEFCFLSKDE